MHLHTIGNLSNTGVQLATVCPNVVVVGPVHDELWADPGFSDLTTPLFNYLSDQSIIVLNPPPRFHDMSAGKRDTWHFSKSANNLVFGTKHLARLGALLRATMSFNH